MQPSSLRVAWVDSTKTYTTNVIICTALSQSEICPITNDQIDLPFFVQMNSEKSEILQLGFDPSLNVVTLNCGHRFNLGALVYHWMYTRMRCPLCNAGTDLKLSSNNFKSKSMDNLNAHLHDKQKVDVLHELLQEQLDLRQIASNELVSRLFESVLNDTTLNNMDSPHNNVIGINDGVVGGVNADMNNDRNDDTNTLRISPIILQRQVVNPTNDNNANRNNSSVIENMVHQISEMRIPNTVIYHVFTIVYLFLDSNVTSLLLPTCLEKKTFRVQKAGIRHLNHTLNCLKPTHINLVTYMVDFLGTPMVIAESEKIFLDPNEVFMSKMFKGREIKHDSYHLIDWICHFEPNNMYDIHNIECASSQYRNVIVCTRS